MTPRSVTWLPVMPLCARLKSLSVVEEREEGRPQLHSSDYHQLLVLWTWTVTFEPCAFYTSGPTSWYSLPATLRNPAVTVGI